MRPKQLSEADKDLLRTVLGKYFPSAVKSDSNDDIAWQHAAPLLAMIVTDRELAAKLRVDYALDQKPRELLADLPKYCEKFRKSGVVDEKGVIVNPYYYRLPLLLGEYPIHTKAINRAIQAFNHLIEEYHNPDKRDLRLDGKKLNACFIEIVQQLEQHGSHCCPESLTRLVWMIQAWSCADVDSEKTLVAEKKTKDIASQETAKLKKILQKTPSTDGKEVLQDFIFKDKPLLPVAIVQSSSKNVIATPQTFREENTYPLNRAGRLAANSHKLVINAFGMKFGGHADAITTHTPSLIPLMDFYASFCRELAQKLELPQGLDAETFFVVVINTLRSMGMVVDSIDEKCDVAERYINPFSTQPLALMTPTVVKKLLRDSAKSSKLSLTKPQIATISDHLSQTIQRMQFNFSTALGIGANDDGTVSMTNDAGAYPFQFSQEESVWASRFSQLSLHRQGPAQAKMNAGKGVAHELAAAFVTEFDKMSQLQLTEYRETIYSAIIDNLVADLFPHPDFFENPEYKKYRKHYLLAKDEKNNTHLTSYVEESATGIFKQDLSLVPRHKRAGTIDVQPLPRDHGGFSQSIIGSYQGNPLAAQQFQYALATYGGERGDIAYNPIGADGFIADMFHGQVIKNKDGSYLPLIGVIPKNFDKDFKQDTELCASFVMRMMHSARLMEYCPTFRETINRIKVNFLPTAEEIVDLPKFLDHSKYLQEKHAKLKHSLIGERSTLDYLKSEKIFNGLFKNIVYKLRNPAIKDERFLNYHHRLISEPNFLRVISCENFAKVIRGLEINAPLNNGVIDAEYLQTLQYLRDLTKSFYPKPCAETSKKIQQQAKAYTAKLLTHADVQDYFAQMRKCPQANLSRSQSPGMVYGTLKHGGATLSRIADLYRMHKQNFISGYRDVEGGLITEPLLSEKILDRVIKGAAQFSVLMQHDLNPLKQLGKPFVRARDFGKNLAYSSKGSAKKRTALGVLGGIAGFCVGLVECPFRIVERSVALVVKIAPKLIVLGPLMLRIESTSKQATLIKEHPLSILAAPPNEPGFKVKISNEVRDVILTEAKAENQDSLIKNLRVITKKIITTAYSDFSAEEIALATDELISQSILTEQQWNEFYNPIDSSTAIGQLLKLHCDQINIPLIAATYRCFLNVDRAPNGKKLIKKMEKELPKITASQKDTLIALIDFFKQADDQATLLKLFSADGALIKKMSRKDNHIQILHAAVMHGFDFGRVRYALYAARKKQYANYAESLTAEAANKLIKILPQEMKSQFEQVHEQKLRVLAENKTSELQIIEFNSKITVLQSIIDKRQQAIVALETEIKEIKASDKLEEEDHADIAAAEKEITAHTEQITRLKSQLDAIKIKIKNSQDKIAENEKSLTELAFPLALREVYRSSEAGTAELKEDTDRTQGQESEAVQSLKDKAHNKWSDFARRELKHKLLPKKDVDKILKYFLDIPAFAENSYLQVHLANFQAATTTLTVSDDKKIDTFYAAFKNLKGAIQDLSLIYTFPKNLSEILEDFVNVSMNAIVNSKLDNIDFAETKLENPLDPSLAIGEWLAYVYQKQADFSSLLAQQAEQQTLCRAIVRKAFIITKLEKVLNLKPVVGVAVKSHLITKTGLQKDLRTYYLQQKAVRADGTLHGDDRIAIGSIMTSSPTLTYAAARAYEKVGGGSRTKVVKGLSASASVAASTEASVSSTDLLKILESTNLLSEIATESNSKRFYLILEGLRKSAQIEKTGFADQVILLFANVSNKINTQEMLLKNFFDAFFYELSEKQALAFLNNCDFEKMAPAVLLAMLRSIKSLDPLIRLSLLNTIFVKLTDQQLIEKLTHTPDQEVHDLFALYSIKIKSGRQPLIQQLDDYIVNCRSKNPLRVIQAVRAKMIIAYGDEQQNNTTLIKLIKEIQADHDANRNDLFGTASRLVKILLRAKDTIAPTHQQLDFYGRAQRLFTTTNDRAHALTTGTSTRIISAAPSIK